MTRLLTSLVSPVVGVAVLLFWEFAVAYWHVPDFLLPAPSQVLMTSAQLLPLLGPHIAVTMWETLLGFAIGVVAGVALAVVMAVLPAVRTAVYPLILATQTTPKIAIAPLLIVWLGIGLAPKIVIVGLLAFFPVLIDTLTGLESADSQQLELLRSVNASAVQEYMIIRFPAAIPFFFAGLKLALSVSVIGAIVGEWVSATQGLGYLLVYYNSTLDTTKLFAVLLVLVILVSLSFAVLGVVEKSFSWESRLRRATGHGVVIGEARAVEAAA